MSIRGALSTARRRLSPRHTSTEGSDDRGCLTARAATFEFEELNIRNRCHPRWAQPERVVRTEKKTADDGDWVRLTTDAKLVVPQGSCTSPTDARDEIQLGRR